MSLKSEWQQYQDTVLPKNASGIQVQETQLSFYAGAAAVIAVLGEIQHDDCTEEEGVRKLQALSDEIQQWAHQQALRCR